MPKIVVIGAGLAGLTTALRLYEKGYDVEVYEARGRVGGRVLTIRVQGHLAELGGENIANGGIAPCIAALMNDLQLQAEDSNTVFDIIYCHDHEQISFSQFLQDAHFTSEIKPRLEAIAKKSKNMEEVLQAFFPQRGFVYEVCKTALTGYEGAPTVDLSVYYIETLYHILMGGFCFAHSNDQGKWPARMDRKFIRGGNSLLPLTMAERVQGRVHLDHALSKIIRENGAYELFFRNGRKVRADYVVLTVPCPVYKDIWISEEVIPLKKQKDIASIVYGTPSKIVLPISRATFVDKQFTNGVLFTFFNRNGYSVNMYYTGGYGKFVEESMQEHFRRDLSFLRTLYTIDPHLQLDPLLDQPFSSYTQALGHNWSEDPFSQGAYSCIGAGQEELFASCIEVKGEKVKTLFAPIDGTLFFAGEHTSTHLEIGGTMEAAVESGEKAASLVEKFQCPIRRNAYPLG